MWLCESRLLSPECYENEKKTMIRYTLEAKQVCGQNNQEKEF